MYKHFNWEVDNSKERQEVIKDLSREELDPTIVPNPLKNSRIEDLAKDIFMMRIGEEPEQAAREAVRAAKAFFDALDG